MYDLTVFGDPVIDNVYSLADPLRIGGKMLGAFTGAYPGGTTANVACAAARFALSARIVGRTGDTDLHHDSFAAFGVQTDSLIRQPGAVGAHTILTIGPDGEKTLIYVPFQGASPRDGAIASALGQTRLAYVMAADFALISGHEGTARICVDVDAAAGLSPADFDRVRAQADILFINDVGFEKLTGQRPAPDAVADMIGPRAQILCCTGGAGTTHLALREGDGVRLIARDARPARQIDSTGAGDCFNAAFLTALTHGYGPDDALAFAMAAGALATETMGARDAIPTTDAVRARMEAGG